MHTPSIPSLLSLLPTLTLLVAAACTTSADSQSPSQPDGGSTTTPDAGNGGGGGGGGGGTPLAQPICDTNLGSAEADIAKAMELCDDSLISIQISSASSEQRGVVPSYGSTYTPKSGTAMATLSTGRITPSVDKNEGEMDGFGSHPAPGPDPANGCGLADPTQIQDMVKVELRLRAPQEATGFRYDFNFMSAEFPEFHCTEFDDTFLAIQTSSTVNGNISFDENNNVISINTGFFDVCDPLHSQTCSGDQDLQGTGFEGRGGTGWLTTTSPITGGEEFTLTFYLFDEGDSILTSQILLDNFNWLGGDVGDGPITIE